MEWLREFDGPPPDSGMGFIGTLSEKPDTPAKNDTDDSPPPLPMGFVAAAERARYDPVAYHWGVKWGVFDC